MENQFQYEIGIGIDRLGIESETKGIGIGYFKLNF